jgi:hypothetical protein
MIQRQQTVFLLLICLLSGIMQLKSIPVFKGSYGANSGKQFEVELSFSSLTISDGTKSELPVAMSAYAFLLCGIIALITIFLFRNLTLQMRLTALNFVFILLGIFYFARDIFKLKTLENIGLTSYSFNWGLIFPILIIVCNFYALKGIRKDIELLASADRLR